MKLTKIKRKELKPGDMFCMPYEQPVSEVYMILRENMIDSLSNAEVLRIEPDDPGKAERVHLQAMGIASTLRTLTDRVSEAETTASPIMAEELQEARTHLLRASRAVERAERGAGT